MARNDLSEKRTSILKTVAGIGATMLAYSVGNTLFNMGISKLNGIIGRTAYKAITGGSRVYSTTASPLLRTLENKGFRSIGRKLFSAARQAAPTTGNKVMLSNIVQGISKKRNGFISKIMRAHKRKLSTAQRAFGTKNMYNPFAGVQPGVDRAKLPSSLIGTRAYTYGISFMKTLPFWYVYSKVAQTGEKFGTKEMISYAATDAAFRGAGSFLGQFKNTVGSMGKLAVVKHPKIAKHTMSAMGSFSEMVMRQMHALRSARAKASQIGTDVGKKGIKGFYNRILKDIKRTKSFATSYIDAAMYAPRERVIGSHIKNYTVMGRAHSLLKGEPQMKGYKLGKAMDKIFQDTIAPEVYTKEGMKGLGGGYLSMGDPQMQGSMKFFKKVLGNVGESASLRHYTDPKIMGVKNLPMDPYVYQFNEKIIDMKLLKPTTWLYGAYKAMSSTLRIGGKPLTKLLGFDSFFKPKHLKKYDDMYMLRGGQSFHMGYRPDANLRDMDDNSLYLSMFGMINDDNLVSKALANTPERMKQYYSIKDSLMGPINRMGDKEYSSFMNLLKMGVYKVPQEQLMFSTGNRMYSINMIDDAVAQFGSLYSYTGNLGDAGRYMSFRGSLPGTSESRAIVNTLNKEYTARRKKPGVFKSFFRRILWGTRLNESPDMSLYEGAYRTAARYSDMGDYYPMYRTLLKNTNMIDDIASKSSSSAIVDDFNLVSVQREVMPRINDDSVKLSLELLDYVDDAYRNKPESLDALKQVKLGTIKDRTYTLFDFINSQPTPNNTTKMQEFEDMLGLIRTNNMSLGKDTSKLVNEMISNGIDSNFMTQVVYKGHGGKMDVSAGRAIKAYVMRDYVAGELGGEIVMTHGGAIQNFVEGVSRSGKIDHFAGKLVQMKMYSVNKGADDVTKFVKSFRQVVRPLQRGDVYKVFQDNNNITATMDDYIGYLDSQHRMFDVTWGRNPYIEVPEMMGGISRYNVVTGHSANSVSNLLYGATEPNTEVTYNFLDELVRSARGADQGMVTSHGAMIKSAINAINNTASFVGLGMAEQDLSNLNTYFGAFIRKKALPIMGMFGAYKVLDTFFDESQLFEQTALGEGLGVFGGSMLVRSRLAAQKLINWGDGRLASHLEERFPGIITSPASGIVRGVLPFMAGPAIGFKVGGVAGATMGGIIGGATSLLMGGGPLGVFGLYDISKSRDQLIAEYSGHQETAVKKGRWWELSSGSFLGEQTQYYRPNWYARMVSQYKYSPDFLQSKASHLLSYMNPEAVQYRNYATRPYPNTSGFMNDVPFVGNMFSFGRDEMYDMNGFAEQSNSMVQEMMSNYHSGSQLGGDLGAEATLSASEIMTTGANAEGFTTIGDSDSFIAGKVFGDITSAQTTNITVPKPLGEANVANRLSSGLYYTTEMFGLRGFGINNMVLGGLGVDTQTIAGYTPTYESAGYAYSPRRAFWDMNLGGLLGTSEYVRRILPREVDSQRFINPLSNLAPNWLPGNEYYIDFQTGDPYAKIPEGELRLPGWGYLASHDVNLDPPADIDYMGLPVGETIAEMLGLNETIGEQRQKDHMLKERYINLLYEESFNTGTKARRDTIYYEPNTRVLGQADIEINRVPHKIYVVSSEEMEKRSATYVERAKALSTVSGKPVKLILINSDTGEDRTATVQGDKSTFQKELKKFAVVRSFMRDNYTSFLGNPNVNLNSLYSVVDRFAILADVAPYSREYNSHHKVVMEMVERGLLRPKELEKVYTSIKQREEVVNKLEFNDDRTPWSAITGGSDPISSKLIGNMDTLQAYKKYRVFGDKVRMWNTPVASFVKPGINSMLGEDRPIQSALSKGIFLSPLYGPTVGIATATAAGAIATVNAATGSTYIPEERTRENEIDFRRQVLEYNKNKMLYAQTGNRSYDWKAMNSNIWGVLGSRKKLTEDDLLRVVGSPDKPYIRSFSRMENRREREEALKYMPTQYRALLKQYWGENNAQELNQLRERANMIVEETPDEWVGYSPEIELKDLEVIDMMNEGLNARHMGMGWHSQLYRMQYNKTLPSGLRDYEHTTPVNSSSLQHTISGYLGGAQVSVIPSVGDGIVVNVYV